MAKRTRNFTAQISSLSVKLPFYLIKNESGLVTQVDTTGFSLDIDKTKIELDLGVDLFFKEILIDALVKILELIKKDLIEKKVIEVMNTKLTEMFQLVNNIILYGVDPEKLDILIDEKDRAEVRNSPILGSVAYLLSNLTGINGPLSLNHIVNIFTFDTGFIRLKNLYDKEIRFEFNLTNKDNTSLGHFEISLDDLNISGLNTWRDFNALEPYDALQLLPILI